MQNFHAIEVLYVELEVDEQQPDRPTLVLDLQNTDGTTMRLTLEGSALRTIGLCALDVQKKFPALLGGH
jgi:hypothetical protein